MKMSKLNMFSFSSLRWPTKKLFLFSCHVSRVRGWKMRFKRIAMTRSGFGIKRKKIYCFFASTSAFSLSLYFDSVTRSPHFSELVSTETKTRRKLSTFWKCWNFLKILIYPCKDFLNVSRLSARISRCM